MPRVPARKPPTIRTSTMAPATEPPELEVEDTDDPEREHASGDAELEQPPPADQSLPAERERTRETRKPRAGGRRAAEAAEDDLPTDDVQLLGLLVLEARKAQVPVEICIQKWMRIVDAWRRTHE